MSKIINFFGKNLCLEEGSVFDIDLKKDLPVHKVDKGENFVMMFGLNGKKVTKVNYGLILLYSIERFFLPIEEWGKVGVDFIDNDFNNYDSHNLTVRYPSGGIEHPNYEGFFYIPGYELNVINKDGRWIQLNRGVVRKPKVCPRRKLINKEYPYCYLTVNNKRAGSKALHRILALTFKNPPKNHRDLVVDHLNGVKYDFRLDNLEWVTFTTNNTRAVTNGLREDGTMILVKDLEDDSVSEYASLTMFARELGIHPQYVVDARTNPNQTYKKRWVIKDFDDARDWSEFEELAAYSDSFRVKARCIFTNEVQVFRTQHQAVVKTKVIKNALRQFFRNESDPCILNGYEFKKEHDNTPWTEFNEYQIEIYKRGLHRKTVVYEYTDLATKEVNVCYGWKPLHELTGVSKRTIINTGANGGVLARRFRLKILH